jgi:UrcA family protein
MMPFVRLSLAAVAATSLSMAFTAAPAQAQYADDPPNSYDRPAPAYYPPAPAYAPPSAGGYYAPAPAYADEAPTVGEVIVRAPYRRSERDPATGAPIERVSTSRIVRYGDLDLTTDVGVHELRYRIVRAAHDACDSLDRHYDVMDAGDHQCVSDAVRNAMHDAPIGYASDAAYEGP